ncbi:hypothetical protein IFO70_36505 [Phormidium tenue FACHB-886]|nr:hypothetical protein [Phormidium tenue FACHB-886]
MLWGTTIAALKWCKRHGESLFGKGWIAPVYERSRKTWLFHWSCHSLFRPHVKNRSLASGAIEPACRVLGYT